MTSQHELRPRTSLILRYIYPNAYLNYMTEFLRNPRNRSTGLRQQRLFKVAAQQWRNMTDRERQPYHDAAEYNKKQAAAERSRNPQPRRKRVRMVCSKCGHRQSRKRKTAVNKTRKNKRQEKCEPQDSPEEEMNLDPIPDDMSSASSTSSF